ncbi:hypothetical protein GGTG_07377 [Gaeumannomyces tritici R3-111a-1]|uniref:Uncharacterized protein n=1 Tax=Gaeumannomyces tritici (strain R3-111a-1) TaxID=644352 RepID=J3P1I0_GAET3|nr:hypothetical protein GGTG_07377 [Gaeumannomyces tritici R3-111a-1]EJT77465.1 hypothetical protein GGTG_07377 [Gaeumannomyces tritici R3-111a-1]
MQMTYYFDLSGACPGIHKWPFDFLDRTPMDDYAPRWSILYSHGAVDSEDDLNMAPSGSNRRPKPYLQPPILPPSPPPSPPCARHRRPASPDHQRRRSPVRRAHNIPGNHRTQLAPAELQLLTLPCNRWAPTPESPDTGTSGGGRGRRATRAHAGSKGGMRGPSYSMGPPPRPTSQQNPKVRSWTPAGGRTGRITICHIPSPPRTASPCSLRQDMPARDGSRSGFSRQDRASMDPFPRISLGSDGPPPFVDMSRKPPYRERSDSAGSSMSGVSFGVAGSLRSSANGQASGCAEPPPPPRHIPAVPSPARAPPADLGHALRKKPAVCDLKEANEDGVEMWAWAATAEMYTLQRRRRR